MDREVQAVIEHCVAQSHAGAISFGDMVGALATGGVESYYADHRARFTMFYMPDGSTHAVQLRAPATDIAEDFDPTAVQAAVRGAQSGKVKYMEFQALTRAAGCIGYFVWIAGRHVAYQGRRGEVHVEHFPDQDAQ